ncbi:HNH endonuclease [Streptomyces sp. NPDC001255]|uniref:HNH endonuclease n=1 Tax=Streptomyces sp. NPDC001255 TaxID=3364550 RepID=UPI0036B38150
MPSTLSARQGPQPCFGEARTSARTTTTRPTRTKGATLVRCLDCTAPAVLRGRCERHHDAYERRASVRARRARRSVLARVYSGAARLRALVVARGGARCERCGSLVLADVVDVDHVRALARGGEDTDGNVQVLCRPCHGVKTGEDFPG